MIYFMEFNILFISLMFIACHTAHQDKVSITKLLTEIMTEVSITNTEKPVKDETFLTTEAFITGNKFSCYGVVDNILSELCNEGEFINVIRDEKAQLALSTLEELKSKGFIMQNSIYKEISGDNIELKYINGA